MKEKILFIMPTQYGYNTGIYHYCESALKEFSVFYVGIHDGKSTFQTAGTNIIYVSPWSVKKFWNTIKMLRCVYKLNREHHFKKVFVNSFTLCSLVLLFLPRNKVIMDIRTSFVLGKYKTGLLNWFLHMESKGFKYVSVISYGVGEYLNIKSSKCRLLPIGARMDKYFQHDFSEINLLYVGTFYDRYIEKTVEGVALFLKKYPDVSLKYSIIGMGSEEEKKRICSAISNNGLENKVILISEKRHKELEPYYESHNVGVSYIPMTTYYDCQPPTKTFEYLANGMVVLGTATAENKKVINKENGVLMETDKVEDFTKGLETILNNQNLYDSRHIYQDALQYSWENIAHKYLMPLIDLT